MRTGVPVFMRNDFRPNASSEAVRKLAAGSAQRPPGTCLRPTCISPRRNVPAVITTALARSSAPHIVRMPQTVLPSVSTSVVSSCQM